MKVSFDKTEEETAMEYLRGITSWMDWLKPEVILNQIVGLKEFFVTNPEGSILL
jgi:hypothetical protein